jgi:lysophospholipase L1-like esterase
LVRSGVKSFPFIQAIAGMLLSISGAGLPAASRQAHDGWVGAWSSAQILVDPANALPPTALKDATLRQLARVSVGGARVRVRVSNAFGTSPLTITGVDIARAISPRSSSIDPATDRQLTFSGARSVVIPAGAEYVSDPVSISVPALATLAVSMHYANLPNAQTGHPGSRATSYVASGDQVRVLQLQAPTTVEHWYYLSDIDVQPAAPSSAIAVLGDSITDGHGVEANTNSRWTDVLLERLKAGAATRSLSVLNVGIGGNRVVDDGIGPNAVARFGRDVLERAGVRYLIILEGVNDLGVLTRDKPASPDEHRLLVARILSAYRQITARAHERGITVIGGTIMPYAGSGYYHPNATNEVDREAINTWIRVRGNFDAVIDFDALVRDPAQPTRLRKDYDSGDGLHPSATGYRAMGEAVPLSLFGGGRR